MSDDKGLSFISSNPATNAFEEGQRAAQQREAADLAIEGQMLQNGENLAAAPSRLRTVQAGARSADANARVAEGTVGSRIATSGAHAATAGADARVATGTVDSRIGASQANAVAAGANARTAGANADVAVNTVDSRVRSGLASTRLAETNANVGDQTEAARVETVQAGARSATSRAQAEEMTGFYKSLDLLNAGDPASAQEVARRYGQEIPPEVINDAELRKDLTDAAKYAQNTYPSRPKDQQQYIQGYLKARAGSKASAGAQQPEGAVGMPAAPAPHDPAAIYNVPGAPTPPEYSGTTNNQHAPADVQISQYLLANGIAKTPEEAWQLTRQSRANPQTTYASVFNNALRANFGDNVKARKIADDFMKVLNQAGGPVQPVRQAPTAAPAQVAPPAAAPGTMQPPPGQGSQGAPFQASTQAHVDWFKNSAPPGAVISVNGQLFTK